MSLNCSKKTVLWVIALLFIVSIILFLKNQNLNFDLPIDPNKFASFGDFIAGILAGISILLLVFTYFFTLETSELQKFENYYNCLNIDINDACYMDKKGVDAYLSFKIDETISDGIPIHHNLFDNLNLVVTSFETYISLVKTNKLIGKKFKSIYLTRLYLLYYSKVLWPLNKTIRENGLTFLNKKQHDDSLLTLPRYSKLSIECINYLIKNDVVTNSEFKSATINDLTKIANHKQS